MNQIDNLSDAANQTSEIVLADGSVATITLTYLAATQRWQMDVSYGSFTANGINLCASLNVLAQWARVLPFGLACLAANAVDPAYQQDFVPVGGAPARVALYLLTADEVKQVRETGTLG